jgi:hypothetical protein
LSNYLNFYNNTSGDQRLMQLSAITCSAVGAWK